MGAKMDSQLQTMIDNMPEKTGKSLEDWFVILKKSGKEKHGELMEILKGEHGVSHGFANTIVLLFRQQMAGGALDEADLVAAQYEKKETLRMLYDKILSEVKEFGPDVEITPKKSYVSLRRSRQFAIVQPSTKTRMDLGLNLRDIEPKGMLIDGDKWSGMCTHRIELREVQDINDEVVSWLNKAYEQAE